MVLQFCERKAFGIIEATPFSLGMFHVFVLLVALSFASGDSKCGGPKTLTNLTGKLSSPNYPQPYERNLDCQWRIEVPEGSRISLTFKSPFEIEENSNYCLDKLEITDGLSTHTLCGRFGYEQIVSEGNSFDIRFTSDYNVQWKGFSIRYVSFRNGITRPYGLDFHTQSGCGGPRDLVEEFGRIVSHRRFGSVAYSDNLHCKWRILGSPDRIIHLQFDSFSLEDSHDCIYDHLAIYDGPNVNDAPFKKLCGHIKPADILSPGQNLVLQFVTDRATRDAGFRIFYSVIDPTDICTPNEFTCANGNCTDISGRCDRIEDCADGSDEWDCFNRDCGAPAIPHYVGNGKIVGGRDARPGSWPWMVKLLMNGHSHYCDGSLITNRWIVTAAYCIDGKLNPNKWKIGIGSRNSREVDDIEVRVDVDLVIKHEDYNSNRIDNNIALIRLAEPVMLNDRISTVCLPKQSVPAGTMCYVTGWGDTKNTGHDDVLKQAYLPVISNEKCNQRSFYSGSITENMLCAGYDEGGHDTCQIGSGGPLVCKGAHRKWEIHGITSWGVGCAGRNKPGVNARVAHFTKWINDTVAGNL